MCVCVILDLRFLSSRSFFFSKHSVFAVWHGEKQKLIVGQMAEKTDSVINHCKII